MAIVITVIPLIFCPNQRLTVNTREINDQHADKGSSSAIIVIIVIIITIIVIVVSLSDAAAAAAAPLPHRARRTVEERRGRRKPLTHLRPQQFAFSIRNQR